MGIKLQCLLSRIADMSVTVFCGIHTVKVWPACTNTCRTGMMWSVMLLNPPEICHLDDCKSLALNTWQQTVAVRSESYAL